ncbi:DeoR/GlpR transcriptional regulator [Erysipelothrix sp. HDW6C]|uniref:DeoR/GlpR family DNA-binding transcription regulator n=1 Tax=Erysipelothrix sp. HDW6C TaxID=2714930 RepID=UPI001409FE24|nr:DeoR/GlpR family DNA-binding transcription regulator [Erysipelothrix sp. HDW6C]QIK68832.1 DeoR/GlpR transcriptional regulator [Erysipelothrix sp. HDW6C]
MKSTQGEVYKRREVILQRLKSQGNVSVNDLADELKVSVITIRRDLALFEKKRMIERTYGGAQYIEGTVNNEYDIATDIQHIYEDTTREQIAIKAMEMLPSDGTVYFNSGLTTNAILKRIPNSNLNIITNNLLTLFNAPTENSIQFTGGDVSEKHNSFVGNIALHIIHSNRAKICFIGTGGISSRLVTTHSLLESLVNRAMIENTDGPKVVVAQGYKIGREHNFMTTPTSLITHLITDSSADKDILEAIRAQGVTIIIADQSITK